MGIVSSVMTLLFVASTQNTNVNPVVSNPCNCVLYARTIREDLPYGLTSKTSKRRIAEKREPKVGDVILTSEGYFGHAGIVIGSSEDEVYFTEANYRRCTYTIRTLQKTNKRILGYF
jgi:hypothetical protein